MSPTLISHVTNKLLPLIREWQSRPPESVYPTVFVDAIHFKIRQEGMVINKVAYMIIGIDMEGMKDVLGISCREYCRARGLHFSRNADLQYYQSILRAACAD